MTMSVSTTSASRIGRATRAARSCADGGVETGEIAQATPPDTRHRRRRGSGSLRLRQKPLPRRMRRIVQVLVRDCGMTNTEVIPVIDLGPYLDGVPEAVDRTA